MTLTLMKSKFSIKRKNRNDSLNQFLAHIYKELKETTQNEKRLNEYINSTVSNNKSSIIDYKDNMSFNSNDSLFTAKNSDIYLDNLNLQDTRLYHKKSLNVDEFEWECSSYLKLLDTNVTPQIMYANKESLEIVYDTRNLESLNTILASFNTSSFTNESSFSLFLHDMFSFVSSLNNILIHNNITLHNLFYDSLTSKFYLTDLQNVVLKSSTEDYISDTSSDSSRTQMLNEYTDLIRLHQLLSLNVSKLSLLKMVNRIFICYIPVDFAKLYKQTVFDI